MPFLEIVTRTYKRPQMLAANQASLAAQTCGDWVQTLLVDEVGRGCGWANAQLGQYAAHLVGEYVWVLDDDDVCAEPSLVEELAAIVQLAAPDVIVMKMDHGPLGVLPDGKHWRKRPVRGRIGVSACVIRRELFQLYAWAWKEAYDGDFDFINAVFDAKPVVFWLDLIASRVQRISRGAPE
jgi:glycosyltransferase involved in cell wall biosynthesis